MTDAEALALLSLTPFAWLALSTLQAVRGVVTLGGVVKACGLLVWVAWLDWIWRTM